MCGNNNCGKCNCHRKEDLDVRSLRAECIDAQCIEAQKANICDMCADHIAAKELAVENAVINDICAPGRITAFQSWADEANFNHLWATDANLTNACITNLKVANFQGSSKFRAAATVSAPILYNLGSNINWNIILDDPNSNITLAPFSYTVPASGYYNLSFYLNSDSLLGSATITGIPVGLLTISVNGSILRQFQAPYLSFTTLQVSNLSGIVLLNAGDVLRMKYEVLVVDPILGLTSYVGTVNINGNALFPESSGFNIIYLSSLSGGNVPVICEAADLVKVQCDSVITPCDPCDEALHHARRVGKASNGNGKCNGCK